MKRTSMFLRVAALFVLAAMVLTACQSAPSTPSAPASGAKKTVGVLIPGPAGYFTATKEGIDKAAAEFNVNVTYADADWDAAKQMSQVEDFIAKKVDMIAVCGVDAKAIEPAIDKAKEANIPILAFTNAIGTAATGEFPGLITYVGQSEVATGKIVGEYAKELLGADGGKVVMIEGKPGTTPQINRREGFLQAINTQSNIEVVFTGSSEWDKEKAIKITEDLIQSKKEFDLVFAQDAGSAAGAAMALQEAGLRDKVYVLGIDGSKEAMQSVKDGLIDCTTWMSAKEEGYKAIEAANKYFNGEKLETVTPLIQILITKENADQYEGEF